MVSVYIDVVLNLKMKSLLFGLIAMTTAYILRIHKNFLEEVLSKNLKHVFKHTDGLV